MALWVADLHYALLSSFWWKYNVGWVYVAVIVSLKEYFVTEILELDRNTTMLETLPLPWETSFLKMIIVQITALHNKYSDKDDENKVVHLDSVLIHLIQKVTITRSY